MNPLASEIQRIKQGCGYQETYWKDSLCNGKYLCEDCTKELNQLIKGARLALEEVNRWIVDDQLNVGNIYSKIKSFVAELENLPSHSPPRTREQPLRGEDTHSPQTKPQGTEKGLSPKSELDLDEAGKAGNRLRDKTADTTHDGEVKE